MEKDLISETKLNVSIFILFLMLIPVVQVISPFLAIALVIIYRKVSKEIPFEMISRSAKRLSLWWGVFAFIELVSIVGFTVITALTLGKYPSFSQEMMMNVSYWVIAITFVHISLCLFSMVKSLEFKFRIKSINNNEKASKTAFYFVILFWLSLITSGVLIFVLNTLNTLASK